MGARTASRKGCVMSRPATCGTHIETYAADVLETERRIEAISAASGAPNTSSTPRGLKSVYGEKDQRKLGPDHGDVSLLLQ